jgi:ribA/ribD-fused uncharacterized protein
MDKNIIKFYRQEEVPYGIFSNFSPHPIGVDGTMWPTSEHYFQAQKFHDSKIRFKIQTAKTPGEAARIGRDRNNPLRKDWENVKDGIMKKAVYAKVLQHSDVRNILLFTGKAKLIEHTTNDSYWADGGDGTGKNMLGIILMEIRNELTIDGNYVELKNIMLPLWLMHPEIERYSIG